MHCLRPLSPRLCQRKNGKRCINIRITFLNHTSTFAQTYFARKGKFRELIFRIYTKNPSSRFASITAVLVPPHSAWHFCFTRISMSNVALAGRTRGLRNVPPLSSSSSSSGQVGRDQLLFELHRVIPFLVQIRRCSEADSPK